MVNALERNMGQITQRGCSIHRNIISIFCRRDSRLEMKRELLKKYP